MINRRRFLQAIGKGVIALAVPGLLASASGCNSYDNIKPNPPIITPVNTLEQRVDTGITPANQILRSFPKAENLPGALSIESYEIPGAKYCLVHIQQIHFYSGENYKTAKEIVGNEEDEKLKEAVLFAPRINWEEINASQKNIYDILESLKLKYPLSQIRAESFIGDYTRDRLEEEYLDRLSKILDECYVTDEEKKANSQRYRYAPGACLILGAAGKLRVLPGEDLELNKTATKNAETDINHPSIYGPREDFFIQASAQGDNPLIVGVYGINHNFLDNIEKWNRDNPDKKFSLIVITPKNQKD